MKRGVWVGGLLLSLGGWASDLLAQDGPWRPTVTGPVPTILAPSELKPCPAASIGRPVAVIDEPKYPPIPFNATPGLLPASYQQPFFPPGSVAPTAKDIPGGESLPKWPEVDDDASAGASSPSGFACARIGQPSAILGTGIQQTSLTADVLPSSFASGSSDAWPTPLPTMQPPLDHAGPGGPPAYSFPANGGDGADFFKGGNAPHDLNPRYSRFYMSAEYLLWWTKKDTAPALVSTSTDNTSFGFLNQPSTSVLFGGPYNGGAQSGLRANAGIWLDSWGEEAVEFGGFYLAQKNTNFVASSDQYTVLARPFFNANTNSEFSELVSYPGISTGNIRVTAPSTLWGLDTNLRCNVCLECDYRFDLFVGLRYLNLADSLNIAESIAGGAGAPAPFTNAQTTVLDSFATTNQFYGGQIGFDSEWKYGAWSVDLRGKLALGATEQTLNINGSETIVPANGTAQGFTGGLLALPSNIGSHSKTEFSVVPEVGLTLGYQLTNTIRVYAGYNFLYWTNVARPGEQIDRNLDVTQIPNFNIAGAKPTAQPTPTVPFSQSNYWAQGIMVGIEFRY